ncbi:MAG: PQQ-binding-like beta-propeller repeat protein, partial [Thermoplasmata archaeon]
MNNIYKTIICVIVTLLLFLTTIPLDFEASGGDETSNTTGARGSARGGLPNDMWPQFRGDSAKTGNTSASGIGYYNLHWSSNIGVAFSSPVVQYDQIYIPTTTGLRCFDLNGNSVWTFTPGSQYVTPLIFSGRVYYAADNGRLYCLDANATGTGTTTNYWTYSPTAGGTHSSPTTDGKMIFYPIMNAAGLTAVWLSNGTKAWNASLGGSTTTEASPAYWDGKVYCGSGSSAGGGTNYLYCFYANNGTLKWKFDAGNPICSTPAVDCGYVYFTNINGKIFCCDADGSVGSTTKVWEYNTNTGSLGTLGSPSVAYGEVYIGDVNSHLYSLDYKGSGGSTSVNWEQILTPVGTFGIYSSPAVTPDYVYVSTSGNAIHCRNRITGALVWSQTYTGEMYGMNNAPAVYKDIVVVASDNGYLYIIRPDIISPKISSSDPANDDSEVDIGTDITIKFDEEIDDTTLTTSSITLVDSQSNPVTGDVTFDMSAN